MLQRQLRVHPLHPGQFALDVLQDPDHLFFGESRLLHAELLGVELYFQVDRINEDASPSTSHPKLYFGNVYWKEKLTQLVPKNTVSQCL